MARFTASSNARLNSCAVSPVALDDAPMMHGGSRINEIRLALQQRRDADLRRPRQVGCSRPRPAEIAASFRVSPTALRRPDRVSRFGVVQTNVRGDIAKTRQGHRSLA